MRRSSRPAKCGLATLSCSKRSATVPRWKLSPPRSAVLPDRLVNEFLCRFQRRFRRRVTAIIAALAGREREPATTRVPKLYLNASVNLDAYHLCAGHLGDSRWEVLRGRISHTRSHSGVAQPYAPRLVRLEHFLHRFPKLAASFPPAFPLSRRNG